jgi:hypothetical protein
MAKTKAVVTIENAGDGGVWAYLKCGHRRYIRHRRFARTNYIGPRRMICRECAPAARQEGR